MILIENTEVVGLEAAMRGMRNPMNSWDRADTKDGKVGRNDHELALKLAKNGPVHAKYRRMMVVYADITAPLYWWKEYDTYKVGTVANSCSTMHKIADKQFMLDDFSCEHLMGKDDFSNITLRWSDSVPLAVLESIISCLNECRDRYNGETDPEFKKMWWWQMIQLLPASYNQKRTVMLNYEVLANIYESRRKHKQDEWQKFCKWIENLPNAELIHFWAGDKRSVV